MMQLASHHRDHLRFIWNCCAVFIVAIAAFFLPGFTDPASAQFTIGSGFTCIAGVPAGDLFISTCPATNVGQGLFSGFVCEFEEIIRRTMAQVYCAIVFEAIRPVTAGLTLMITVSGAALLMGVTPFTAKELMLILGKFSLILAFALDAEAMIGIGYNLFMAISREGIVIVLNQLYQGTGVTDIYSVYALFDQATNDLMNGVAGGSGENNQCSNGIFAMITLMIATVPPLFAIASYFAVKLLWVILRAVFGYCQGILGVTFLVTLAPIFVSFAMFKPTRTLFDKWVQYLISFSFQMIIVFAFIGMVFTIMNDMAAGASSYTNLVRPYKETTQDQSFIMPWDVCGICETARVQPGEEPRCISDRVLRPSEMVTNENFLHFATIQTIGMVIMFFLLDMMMDFVPQMARYLAGPRYAGQLGGGDTGGVQQVDMSLPGEQSIRNALNKGAQEITKGGPVGNTARRAWNAGGAVARELDKSATAEAGAVIRNKIGVGAVYGGARAASGRAEQKFNRPMGGYATGRGTPQQSALNAATGQLEQILTTALGQNRQTLSNQEIEDAITRVLNNNSGVDRAQLIEALKGMTRSNRLSNSLQNFS